MKGLFSAKLRGGHDPDHLEGGGRRLSIAVPTPCGLRGFTAVGSELFEFVQVDDLFKLRLPTMGRVMAGSRLR